MARDHSEFTRDYVGTIPAPLKDIFKLRIAQEVREDLAPAGTVLIKEDGHFLKFIARGMHGHNDGHFLILYILTPFLENVVRNLVLQTKGLEGLAMRQSLRPVLKVKPFQIFAAIHKFEI